MLGREVETCRCVLLNLGAICARPTAVHVLALFLQAQHPQGGCFFVVEVDKTLSAFQVQRKNRGLTSLDCAFVEAVDQLKFVISFVSVCEPRRLSTGNRVFC